MYQDLYLSFQDAKQAASVLYTITLEVINENGVVIVEAYTTPKYQNISVLGTVYEPAPEPTPEGYVPVPYPAPNYGVNVRLVEGVEDPAPLLPYSVDPRPFPQRIWA